MKFSKNKLIVILIIFISIVIFSYVLYKQYYFQNEYTVIVKNMYNHNSDVQIMIGEKEEKSVGMKEIYDIKVINLDYNEACIFHVKFKDIDDVNAVYITAEDISTYNPSTNQANNNPDFVSASYEFPDDEYYDLMAIIIPRMENNTIANNENTTYNIHDLGLQDYADIIFTEMQDNTQIKNIYID